MIQRDPDAIREALAEAQARDDDRREAMKRHPAGKGRASESEESE